MPLPTARFLLVMAALCLTYDTLILLLVRRPKPVYVYLISRANFCYVMVLFVLGIWHVESFKRIAWIWITLDITILALLFRYQISKILAMQT